MLTVRGGAAAPVLPQREEYARGSLAELKLGIPLFKPLERAPAQPLAFFTPPGESRKRSGEGDGGRGGMGGQQYWGQQPERTHGIEDEEAPEMTPEKVLSLLALLVQKYKY